ncbi:MAG: hypothetical protein ISS15_17620 [Alphaproteobacteria bacterium]|nr:hypothetical protein [Alphaproteobacteria bacterium]MBL6938889.1 hypothetical protein [Alphaproteobacteria bacterium]MBL7099481.1 hypothetical protein [Alphaproteobacteria bacterium]
MSLTPNEAAAALRDIETVGRRSGQAFGYRYSGPYFVTWGLVWVAGYTGTDLLPHYAGTIWIASLIGGLIATTLLGARQPKGSRKNGIQAFGVVAIAFLFIMATYAVMWPVSPAQQAAFVPLLAAAAYSGVGLWAGARWIVAGVGIAVLTLAGFFLLQQHFSLYMAVVGGGGLILAGLWMRSA